MRSPELQSRLNAALAECNRMFAREVGRAPMRQKRDLTQAQFEYRAKKLGCNPEGFWGYWKLPSGVSVSVLNAGNRRRDQLRWLKKQLKRHPVIV